MGARPKSWSPHPQFGVVNSWSIIAAMSEPELKDTQPGASLGETRPSATQGETRPQPSLAASKKTRQVSKSEPADSATASSNDPAGSQKPKKGWSRWLVALLVIILIAIGVLSGYSSGMGRRYAAQRTQVVGQLEDQFKLGQEAFNAGNYELARQYFEGIIRADPNYPGITAAYTDLLLKMQVTPTPVFSPTPLVSPTPDLRGFEDIFNTAQQLLNASNWNGAITNLDSLRKSNPDYRTAEVDGMYYMALRQRGVGKIAAGCQDVNLEGGIYDLTLAEHFVGSGNLDAYADSLRTYSRLYIIGASFWDQDWLQAQNFFAQVMNAYPNLSDSSCETSTKRWVEATNKVADQYLALGDYCNAKLQYDAAFGIGEAFNATAYPTATEVSAQCDTLGGSTLTPGGVPLPTETPTP
jgi:tetratricopeptide (TPR) repeat protein